MAASAWPLLDMNEDNFLDKDSNASFNSRSISGLSATFSFPTVMYGTLVEQICDTITNGGSPFT